MKVIIVTAYRPDAGIRDRNWRYARDRWTAALDWPIYAADDGSDLFSRGGSRNLAAEHAGDWDVALIADADIVLADAGQARDAALLAHVTGELVYPHNHLTMLEEAPTAAVIAGADPAAAAAGLTRHPNTWSQALAVPRRLWDEVRGYDPRFVDWGWEDLAFMAACSALGGLARIPGDAYHLWHPRTWVENEGNPHHNANMVLGRRYLDARRFPDEIREIIAERDRVEA